MSILVDGHAHFHNCYGLQTFLESVATNTAPHSNVASAVVLLLAHFGGNGPLDGLERGLASLPPDWSVSRPDATSIVFARPRTPPIVCLAGRQIVTQEKLELHAMCSDVQLKEGRPLVESIQQIVFDDGVPVLPWGFGKWWFSRGAIIRSLLRGSGAKRFLLSDNGCRPDRWRPRMLQYAEQCDVAVLAGTDPLPILSHQRRVASFGSVLSGTIDLKAPTQWMRSRLFDLSTSPPTFGNCRSIGQFARDQFQLRLWT